MDARRVAFHMPRPSRERLFRLRILRRTRPWEWRPGDADGAWHAADGATWFGAFQEALPLEGFDWTRVPGTTVLARPGKNFTGGAPVKAESPSTGFAGALAFGASGVAAQVLDSRDEASPNTGLAAHKAWFFFSNHAMLCLGHGITSTLASRRDHRRPARAADARSPNWRAGLEGASLTADRSRIFSPPAVSLRGAQTGKPGGYASG
jgi:hypothetical protein